MGLVFKLKVAFFFMLCWEKCLKDKNQNSLHLGENMLEYFSWTSSVS